MLYFIKLSLLQQLDNDGMLRMKLALHLGISERAIYNAVKRQLADNTPNSTLTKLAAIEFFRTEGYTDDEIFYKELPA